MAPDLFASASPYTSLNFFNSGGEEYPPGEQSPYPSRKGVKSSTQVGAFFGIQEMGVSKNRGGPHKSMEFS